MSPGILPETTVGKHNLPCHLQMPTKALSCKKEAICEHGPEAPSCPVGQGSFKMDCFKVENCSMARRLQIWHSRSLFYKCICTSASSWSGRMDGWITMTRNRSSVSAAKILIGASLIYIQGRGVTKYMLRRYVFKIQNMSNCISL